MEDLLRDYKGWHYVRQIGSGGFGTVYEIEDDLTGSHSALKIISIPQNQNDVTHLEDSGYSADSITRHYKNQLEKTQDEYKLLASLKSHPNIVHCEAVDCMAKPSEFGWNVFIRMELLQPLPSSLGPVISEETVIKIAVDMCNALIACRQKHIIHRDIKPDNIFISDYGNYKLGDFGIAKNMILSTNSTRIGTYDYMAPEVFTSVKYDGTIDIYSLGLVLYWLLNDRCLPFITTRDSIPSDSEKQEAFQRRIKGEELPPLGNGSSGFHKIILKACSYHPQDRYQTPEEMLLDIQRFNSNPTPEEVWTCRNCGSDNRNIQDHCSSCGQSRFHYNADKIWICQRCGTENRESQDQCIQCGQSKYTKTNKAWLFAGIFAALAIIVCVVMWFILHDDHEDDSSMSVVSTTPTYAATSVPAISPPPTDLKDSNDDIPDENSSNVLPDTEPSASAALPDTTAPSLSDLEAWVSSGKVKTKSNTGYSLQLPTKSQMLNEPFRSRVYNKGSTVGIYIMPMAKSGHGHIGIIYPETEVWILAETPYYYFFVSDDYDMGWNGTEYFK